MNARSRRLRWTILLGTTAALAILLRHSANRHREIEDEIARTGRETVQTNSALLLRREQEKQLAEELAAMLTRADDPPLSVKEQRQRDILARLENIPLPQNAVPRPPLPSGPQGNIYFSELMEIPGYRENVRGFFRSTVETRYGPWLHSISSPELRAKAEEHLVEDRLTDTTAAAAHAGLDPEKNRSEVMRLQMQLAAARAVEFRKMLGEEEHARFLAYSTTLPARDSIAALARRLSYSAEPITPEQIDRIVPLLPQQSFGPRFGTNAPSIEDVLLPAKALFTAGQWEDVQEFARDGGTLRP